MTMPKPGRRRVRRIACTEHFDITLSRLHLLRTGEKPVRHSSDLFRPERPGFIDEEGWSQFYGRDHPTRLATARQVFGTRDIVTGLNKPAKTPKRTDGPSA